MTQSLRLAALIGQTELRPDQQVRAAALEPTARRNVFLAVPAAKASTNEDVVAVVDDVIAGILARQLRNPEALRSEQVGDRQVTGMDEIDPSLLEPTAHEVERIRRALQVAAPASTGASFSIFPG